MTKEFKVIKESGIAIVQYSNQYECLADKSKDTIKHLQSTKKVEKSYDKNKTFVVLRKSKRGGFYILIRVYDTFMDVETNCDKNLSKSFNPEVNMCKNMIEEFNKSPKEEISMRFFNKLYNLAVSRARKIDYIASFKNELFEQKILPEFMVDKNFRVKVFLPSKIDQKVGG